MVCECLLGNSLKGAGLMWFWVFMLIMVLLIPITMIGFGRMFMKRPPDKINGVFGYRTKRSMQSKENWDFAHRYVGRIWFISGSILFPISFVIMLLMLGKDDDVIGTIGGIMTVLQLLPMCLAIVPTENALRKRGEHNERD